MIRKDNIQNEHIQDEHWIRAYWRPAMGWLYMAICACDFVLFPLLSMFLPLITHQPFSAWRSLTLDNGGMVHLAFGAILGVSAYTRGRDKNFNGFDQQDVK